MLNLFKDNSRLEQEVRELRQAVFQLHVMNQELLAKNIELEEKLGMAFDLVDIRRSLEDLKRKLEEF